jgi:hypothetical protein
MVRRRNKEEKKRLKAKEKEERNALKLQKKADMEEEKKRKAEVDLERRASNKKSKFAFGGAEPVDWGQREMKMAKEEMSVEDSKPRNVQAIGNFNRPQQLTAREAFLTMRAEMSDLDAEQEMEKRHRVEKKLKLSKFETLF